MVEPLLTDDEHEALRLSAELANKLRAICGDGHDWTEAAQRIHVIQHMVMAQAAARAYPDLYRLLGGQPPEPKTKRPRRRSLTPFADYFMPDYAKETR